MVTKQIAMVGAVVFSLFGAACGEDSGSPILPDTPSATAGREVRVLSPRERLRAIHARSRLARARRGAPESLIRVYNRDGGVIKELIFRGGSAVERPSSMPGDLMAAPLSDFVTTRTGYRGANAFVNSSSLLLRGGSFSATVGGESVTFVDSTATSYTAGLVDVSRDASDPTKDFVGTLEFANAAVVDSVDLATTADLVLPLGDGYVEMILTGNDMQDATQEWRDSASSYGALRADLGAARLSGDGSDSLSTYAGFLPGVSSRGCLGGSVSFAQVSLRTVANCDDAWHSYYLKSGAAAVATGAAVGACATNPVIRFVTCGAAREVAVYFTGMAAVSMADLVVCLVTNHEWPFNF